MQARRDVQRERINVVMQRARRHRTAATASLLVVLLTLRAAAQPAGSALEAARQSYLEGNFRRAAARLNDVAAAESRLPAGQRLLYWNLCVDVALDSGLIESAEKLARTHFDLLRQAAATGADEQAALVRLARIERQHYPATVRQSLSDESATASWNRARRHLEEALAIDGGLRPVDPVWEAETRLELARTIETLGQAAEARKSFAEASDAGTRALKSLLATQGAIDVHVRAVAAVRQSFAEDDAAAERRQAELALEFVEKHLQSADLAPADRVKLLAAGAACRRQLADEGDETRMLREALATADNRADVEPLERADILIRLAELADSGSDAAERGQAAGLYRNAAQLYAQVLADARQGRPDAAGVKRSISVGEQADCLLQLQLIRVRLEEWDGAIAAAEELLALRGRSLLSRGDPNFYRAKTAVGSLYAKAARSALARTAGEVRDLSTAREKARQAQLHLEEAAAWWRNYRPTSRADLAATLNYLAEALRYSGDFRCAKELLDEAEPHFAAAFESNAPPLGEFYSNRGAVLAALGAYQPALASYEAAIAVADGGSDEGKARRERGQLLAFVHLNMAQLFKSQGQYERARAACEKALQAAEEWLGSADRVPFQLADAALAIVEGEDLARRGGVAARTQAERELGERQWNQAREAMARAIEVTQLVIDDAGPESDPVNVASAQHLQALAHYRSHRLIGPQSGSLARAQELWEGIAGATATTDMRFDLLKVRALTALAGLALRQAAELRGGAREEEDAVAAGELLRRGDAQLGRAEHWSEEARRIAEAIPAYPAVRFQALLGRAQVWRAAAQVQRAAAERLRSKQQPELSQQADAEADAATRAAIDTLGTALSLVELPRAMTTGAEEQRAAYFAQFSPGFDLLVDLLVERGDWRGALETAERRRSRTFRDQLQVAGVDLYETVPAGDRHLVDQAQNARDAYYTCLAQLVTESAQRRDTQQLAVKLAGLQRELVEADEQVRSASTVYRQLLVAPATGQPDAVAGDRDASSDEEWIAQQIGNEDVALVYYVGSERSYVLECSRRKGIRCTPLTVRPNEAGRLGLPLRRGDSATAARPLRAEDVAKLAGHVAAFMSRPPENGTRNRGDDLQIVTAAKISPADLAIITRVLIPEPVQERLSADGFRHVIIVPDGGLHQMAFEALPTMSGGRRYLVDRWPPMCYAPSLAIYRQLREQAASAASGGAMLSVADPLYREETGGAGGRWTYKASSPEQDFIHYLGRPGLARLPATKVESTHVQRAFARLRPSEGDVIALSDENATEARLKEALRSLAAADRGVRFLHVAAHGLVDQRYNNLFGALALTPPTEPTADDDGFLTLYEVMMLPLAGCDLAVLSACETNCGPENALEAGSTMARAFFCAGAKRVVCSHWKVSDEATAALVADFVDRVTDDIVAGRSADYAAALQQAKQRLRQQHEALEPYFWAPFVLIGAPTGETEAANAQKRVATKR